jgi:WXG100 family type VII secretion target
VPGWIRVDPDQMRAAAVHVDGQAEDISVGHASVHSRMEAAQAGWAGASAAALTARVAEWQTSVALIGSRIADHGAAFHGGAEAFAQSEDQNRQALTEVGLAGAETDSSVQT